MKPSIACFVVTATLLSSFATTMIYADIANGRRGNMHQQTERKSFAAGVHRGNTTTDGTAEANHTANKAARQAQRNTRGTL